MIAADRFLIGMFVAIPLILGAIVAWMPSAHEFASTCIGLLVSTVMSNPDKAMLTIVPIAIAQIASSGALFAVGTPVLRQLAGLFPVRWGMAALASTARLDQIAGGTHDAFWQHTRGTWLFDFGMMLCLSVVYVLAAWLLLTRLPSPLPGRVLVDPAQRGPDHRPVAPAPGRDLATD